MKGLIFSVKRYAIHDGPGIRVTFFMKGCPLDCWWCHNPEGKATGRVTTERIDRVGEQEFRSREIVGMEYTPGEVLAKAERDRVFMEHSGGGVTFSGGEPLFQADFVVAVARRLEGVHRLLQTAGYGAEETFAWVLEQMDMVFFDLKIIDKEAHRRYTGAGNELILRNLDTLSRSEVPYVVRVPLVPGVTDTGENLAAMAEVVRGLRPPLRIDLLPYNPVTGGKYAAAGMAFRPGYDETRPPNLNTALFKRTGVEVRVA